MNPVLSAYVGDNSDLFPNVLSLYVKNTDEILDMTWGLGTFWKKVDQSKYKQIIRNDIDPERGDFHDDFRCTGFIGQSFDVVVLDPPYSNRSSNKTGIISSLYNNKDVALNTMGDILKFYEDGMKEAFRLLRKNGVLFVKCQDEVSGGKQQRNHISIWNSALGLGFIDEDLFTLVNPIHPIMRHPYQHHSRKNNSFLWVFRKK